MNPRVSVKILSAELEINAQGSQASVLDVVDCRYWMLKVGTLITLCCGIFFVLTLTASVVSPKFIVPNLPDLAIKTRRSSGDGFSQLNMLYLKGSRQRTETVLEKPVRADAINLTVIRQCDEKRVFVLNERDKIYNSSAIKDRSEWLRKTRPINSIQLSGAEVIMTIDSVDNTKPFCARNVSPDPKSAEERAKQIGVDAQALYRLMRATASVGVLSEKPVGSR